MRIFERIENSLSFVFLMLNQISRNISNRINIEKKTILRVFEDLEGHVSHPLVPDLMYEMLFKSVLMQSLHKTP